MDRQKLIGTIAETQEDQILLARVWDRISGGERRNIPSATCFLTGREQLLAERLCRQGNLTLPRFFGGYEGAERRVAIYLPDYLEPEAYLTGEEGPVSALRVNWSDYDSLNHRDFLGSLMGQGIKREILGDLLPGQESCDILVLRDMADYLAGELTHVGRAKVHTSRIALSELLVPEQKVKIINDTVASLRLDSVIKAAALIQSARVEVNHKSVLKPDALLEEGDVISARGLGKLKVAQVKGQTKKGRTAVRLERYL